MIDLLAHFGRARRMIGYEDLMMVLDKDKVAVEQGDFVCSAPASIRCCSSSTASPDESVHDICAVLDGRDARLQQWVTDAGVVALISDNYAVEGIPSRPCDEHADHCASLPLHAHCLFRLGVYLGEIWYLSELADWLRARKRNRASSSPRRRCACPAPSDRPQRRSRPCNDLARQPAPAA